MSDLITAPQKEFLLTESDFSYLRKLAANASGLNITEEKRELVYGRLVKRLRSLGMKNFRQYCDYLKRDDKNSQEELTNFINAMTTNTTAFFRENHHYEYLKNTLFPELIVKNRDVIKPRLRIWSAGCSEGQEVYSIAMVLKECIPEIESWDVKILATDIDSDILKIAKRGIYSFDSIKDISKQRRKRWFQSGVSHNNLGMVKVRDEIKKLVSFRQLNITEQWPMQGLFDVVFYRNLAIYFDMDTRINVLDKMANQMMSGSHLFVGHSESLFGLTEMFATVGHTIHTKILDNNATH